MVRKQYMWAVAAAFLMATAGLAVAGSMGSSQTGTYYDQGRSVDSENSVGQPEVLLFSEPVETGAIPEAHTAEGQDEGMHGGSPRGPENVWSHPDTDAGGGSE